MRSGAANTERSDDDLEAERGKHQRDPKVFTNQQTCHYLAHFGAQRLRPTFMSGEAETQLPIMDDPGPIHTRHHLVSMAAAWSLARQ